jgi:DNA polymerase-1
MFVIVDGMAEAYRQYYAIKLSNSKNVQTGAIYGFLRAMLSYGNQFNVKPCIAWESPNLYRSEIYPEYKKDGRERIAGVYEQVKIIKELMSLLGVEQYYADRREADDVMYSYAKTFGKNDTVIIVTLDSDLFQTVDENIRLFNPRLKKMFNAKDVFDELGVFPNKVAFLKAILGDQSDNIRGVKKLLYKVVSQCLYEYNTIDQLIEDKLNIALKVKDKVKENLALIKMNLSLTELKNIYEEIKEIPTKLDKKGLDGMLSELEFFSYLKENEYKLRKFKELS